MANTRIDSTLLAKAKYEYDKEVEKLSKYNLLPDNHNPELFVKGTQELPEGHVLRDITPLMISDAAEARAAEYGKDIKVYTKELEYSLNKLEKFTPKEVIKMNYRRFESYDIAEEAAQAEDPFDAILSAESAL